MCENNFRAVDAEAVPVASELVAGSGAGVGEEGGALMTTPQSTVSATQDTIIREHAAREASISEIMAATGLNRGQVRRYMAAKGIVGRQVGWSRVSEDARTQAAAMLKAGISRAEVSRKLGIAGATLGAIKAAAGIPKARFLYTAAEDATIRSMAARKASLKEIHAALADRTYASLNARCALLGLRVTDERAQGPHVIARIRELAEQGWTDAKIGAEARISPRHVRKMRRANGIASRVHEARMAERAARPKPAQKPRAPVLRAVRPEMAKIIAVLPLDPAASVEARDRAVTRRGCDMPMWGDGGRPTHVYCGEPVKLGRPYCEGCNRRVFTKAASVGFMMKGWGTRA